MNGNEPKIEFVKPFEEAFELMKKILFQPFDLGKWCVIGFAAWLAQLGSGGGFNFRYNRGSDWRHDPALQQFFDTITSDSGLDSGLRDRLARSDHYCPDDSLRLVTRTRAIHVHRLRCKKSRGHRRAVARVSRTRQQLFSFFTVGWVLPNVSDACAVNTMASADHSRHNAHPSSRILFSFDAPFVGSHSFVPDIRVGVVVAHYGGGDVSPSVPRAGGIERHAIALINQYPGEEITLYCLFWIALAIGTVFAACILVCATCCIAAIPYIGTVILLPIYVLLHAFVLLFFRQFGPDFDVWAGAPLPNELPPTQVPPPLPR